MLFELYYSIFLVKGQPGDAGVDGVEGPLGHPGVPGLPGADAVYCSCPSRGYGSSAANRQRLR